MINELNSFKTWECKLSNLWASSPGRSGGGAGKERKACNYVSGIWISTSKSRCEMLIGGDDISNDVITLGTCFSKFVPFALVSASRWLAEIWQLSQQGATDESEVEFKFQRRSCKLSFLFPPRRQSAPESYAHLSELKRTCYLDA